MKIVTSLSPNRIPRQQQCITTFPQRVVCVQGPGECEVLTPHFPSCHFVVGATNTSFSKPTPKITELIKEAAFEPALIINSDISMSPDVSVWEPVPGTLKIGIRTDFTRNRKTLQKWGIDAFLILPEMVPLLPDVDFAVGCPGWDFWVPYVLHRFGYNIQVVQTELLHEIHEQAWSAIDYEVYKRIMFFNYRVHNSSLSNFILDVTNRLHL